MKTTAQGLAAETAVAELLEQQGLLLIDRNWKTKLCEIDLIMQKTNVVYFIEVKYRASQDQGSGFEYITNKKLKRMAFAAELWTQHHKWSKDYLLMAAAVSGANCQEIQITEVG